MATVAQMTTDEVKEMMAMLIEQKLIELLGNPVTDTKSLAR